MIDEEFDDFDEFQQRFLVDLKNFIEFLKKENFMINYLDYLYEMQMLKQLLFVER